MLVRGAKIGRYLQDSVFELGSTEVDLDLHYRKIELETGNYPHAHANPIVQLHTRLFTPPPAHFVDDAFLGPNAGLRRLEAPR